MFKPITDYAVLKKAFPNGFIETTRDAFIRLGDIMTIPSDEVRAVFTEDEKIRILTERVDAKEQYLALFRLGIHQWSYPNTVTFSGIL